MKYMLFLMLIALPFCDLGATHPYVAQQQLVQVQVGQKLVNFNEQTYAGVDGYYRRGEELRANKVNAQEEQIAELKKQNSLLNDILNELRGKKGSQPATPTESPKPDDSNVVPPAETPQGDLTKLEKSVLDIFNVSCAKCHGDTKQDAGLALVRNGQLQLIDLSDAVLIHHRTNGVNLDGEARMPKGSVPLSTDNVETIRLWSVELAKKSKE